MKAIWFERAGAAEEVLQYGEREKPAVAAGEVLVRMRVSAVNPSDVKKRGGQQPAGLEEAGFVIPHSDGAGVIEDVGEGVARARIGERVWIYQAQFRRHLGTAAEYVALPAARAAMLPTRVSLQDGACLGIPLMTAHRCVRADGDVDGQTILVSGAAGRVGFYAAQLARLGGARVIGSAGGAARRRIANAVCDAVFDYRDENFARAVLEYTGGKGVDKIIEVEFGANLERNTQILKANGIIATYASSRAPAPQLPFYQLMFGNALLRLVLVYDMPEEAKRRAIAEINLHLERGELRHRYAPPRKLQDAAQAHREVEAGGGDGCVLLEIA